MWTALGVKPDKRILRKAPVRSKLPPRLLNQCLRDIFTYLLSESPTVVVIEQIHHADVLSWDVIVNLVNISSMALFVITMEPLQDLLMAKTFYLNEAPRGNVQIRTFFFYFALHLSLEVTIVR